MAINRATLSRQRLVEKAVSKEAGPCIFLSHISEDKNAVVAIGNYIQAYGGIDIYLDIEDPELQQAVEEGDDYKITKAIEIGIMVSTHAMCLYSTSTVRSWWVPYELGYAKRSNSQLSSLKLKGKVQLPGYLNVSTKLMNISDLNAYLTDIRVPNGSKVFGATYLADGLIKNTESHPLDNYMDWH